MPSTSPTFRPAVATDATPLAAFGARAFRAAFAADNNPADLEQYLASSFTPEQIAAEIADPDVLFLLAFLDNTLIGYTKLSFGSHPQFILLPHRPVELVRIYVDPKKIARGLGSALVRASLEAAHKRSCQVIWLGVWENNERAINFYHKWGFKVVGTQRFVLGQEVQRDLVMSRSIDGEPR